MDEIIEICRKNNLKLIEDACHAPLSKYKGRTIGTESDIACYSFFSNKNISTGEGGMIVTNNNYYNNKARLLRSHGMTSLSYERSKGHSTGYDVVELGFNYRLDDMRASLGIAQLKKLKKDILRRMELRKLYIEQLSEIEELIIPFKDHIQFCSNYIFPVVLKDSNYIERGNIRCYLSMKGIQTSIHYPAVHQFRIYNNQYYNLPVTEYFASTEITLPLYSNLSEENLIFVCTCLKEAIYKSRNEKKTFTCESNQ
jgi:dTDP-4-amino-4,6-dideoxygalactose transaminase